MEILPIILIVQIIIIIITILMLIKLKNQNFIKDSKIEVFFISSGICLIMFVSILIMIAREINGIKHKVGAPGKRGVNGKEGMLGPPGSR